MRHTMPNGHEDVRKLEFSCICGGNVKCDRHFGKHFWQFLRKLNINLPYEPKIPFLYSI